MFITPAFAQAGDAAVNPFLNLAPMVLILVIFYFLLIRPQQQARKRHQEMVSNVRRGDQVVTAGGIVGKVSKVLEGDEIMVQIADNVSVKVMKSTLSTVLTRPDASPANDG